MELRLLGDDTEINAKAVVITTGVDYRKLNTDGIADFTGKGIYYGAASTEAPTCDQKEVFVLGGGNSAGQAAMYLSKFALSVNIIVRKDDLSSSMSSYLIDQLGNTSNVRVLGCTEIVQAIGNEHLEGLKLMDLKTNTEREVKADALFIFIGAKPFTDWICLEVIKNDKGFIETGRDLKSYDNFKQLWKKDRDPFLLETSSPGIFAAGDVRAGAMNRVTSAVGEGSMAISFVHQYLNES